MRNPDKKDVYTSLREEITLLKLLPGAELNVDALTEKYSVSRSPVRDALLRLERDRLVDIFPQRGTRVSFLEESIIEEERFMRKCVELGAVERCMKKSRSEKEFEAFVVKLESNLLIQKAALIEEDYGAFYKADDDLHHLFYTESSLENVWAVVDAHTGNDKRIRMLSYSDKAIAEGVREQHMELVGAVKEKNLEKVLDVERRHLEKVENEIKGFEEQYPTYFIKRK